MFDMKKITLASFIVFSFFATTSVASAQMMGGFSNTSTDWDEVVEHTLREEQEGKELWEKFGDKEISCTDFEDEQFGVLGEYFMGQMMGDSHAAMNAMMIQAHGEEGEEQIHIAMGKRLSGCDTSAGVTGISGGWMPMMQMMWGGWSSPFSTNQSNNSMMNFGFMPFGGFGWIFMLVFWGFIIWMIVSLIRGNFGGGHMRGHSHGNDTNEKSPLEILKDRYAKGEIDKREFEEKKKDLI